MNGHFFLNWFCRILFLLTLSLALSLTLLHLHTLAPGLTSCLKWPDPLCHLPVCDLVRNVSECWCVAHVFLRQFVGTETLLKGTQWHVGEKHVHIQQKVPVLLPHFGSRPSLWYRTDLKLNKILPFVSEEELRPRTLPGSKWRCFFWEAEPVEGIHQAVYQSDCEFEVYLQWLKKINNCSPVATLVFFSSACSLLPLFFFSNHFLVFYTPPHISSDLITALHRMIAVGLTAGTNDLKAVKAENVDCFCTRIPAEYCQEVLPAARRNRVEKKSRQKSVFYFL